MLLWLQPVKETQPPSPTHRCKREGPFNGLPRALQIFFDMILNATNDSLPKVCDVQSETESLNSVCSTLKPLGPACTLNRSLGGCLGHLENIASLNYADLPSLIYSMKKTKTLCLLMTPLA